MCGRFAQPIPLSTLKIFFDIEKILNETPPSYNIAPSQDIMTITSEKGKTLRTMTWGLIPGWARGKTSSFKPLINARAETVHEKPSFRSALKQRRCLIPAGGFYEWKNEGKEKIPYYIKSAHGELMAFGGIYEKHISEENEEILTCAIITTTANKLFEEIHERMPLIIKKEDIDLWLATTIDLKDIAPLLQPITDSEIEYYRVNREVNSPQNNSSELILPE